MANRWHQLEYEGDAAYNAFRVGYLELGPERTLQQAASVLKREPKTIVVLSKRFEWVPRARAYDRWLFSVEEAAVKKSIEKDSVEWARRRSQFREKEWTLAGDIFDLAKKLIDHYNSMPLTEQSIESDTLSEDGVNQHTVIVIKPLPVKISDIGTLAKACSELARLSSGMETERKLLGIDVTGDFRRRLQTARDLYDRFSLQYAHRPDVLAQLAPLLATQWGVEPLQLTDGLPNESPSSDEPETLSESEN